MRYFKTKYNMRIGETTAERLKMSYGTVSEKYNGRAVTIKGLDLQNGLPRQLILTNSCFIEATKEVVDTIISAIINTLEKLPAELVGDLFDRGIILTGGGALLSGLDEVICDRTSLPVSVAHNALYSVAEGTRLILNDFKSYQDVLLRR